MIITVSCTNSQLLFNIPHDNSECIHILYTSVVHILTETYTSSYVRHMGAESTQLS